MLLVSSQSAAGAAKLYFLPPKLNPFDSHDMKILNPRPEFHNGDIRLRKH